VERYAKAEQRVCVHIHCFFKKSILSGEGVCERGAWFAHSASGCTLHADSAEQVASPVTLICWERKHDVR
jgi:hypothetical protein